MARGGRRPAGAAADSVDVLQYKLENDAFPRQTTADQWYEESQFESYRALRYQPLAARLDARDLAGLVPRTPAQVAAFFARL